MSNFNHNRPHLKNIDNNKKVLAEIESRHDPVKTQESQKLNKLDRKQKVDTNLRKVVGKKISGKDLDKTIHIAACNAVAHVMKHREVGLCNKLCHTLSGVRQEAMIDWFVTYASCRYDSQKKELVFLKGGKNLIQECKNKTFLEFKRKPEEKDFNLCKSLVNLIKTAENHLQKKIVCNTDNKDPELLRDLTIFLKKHQYFESYLSTEHKSIK